MKIPRLIATASALAVGALVLASCSGGGDQAPSADGEVSGTLTGVFASAFQDTYEALAAEFVKEYPDVDIKFDYQGGDINQLVMTQLQGGTAPDILTSFPGGDAQDNADNVVPLAAQGHIAPLDVSWADQIPEAWSSSFNYDGETYAYPGALQPLAAIYNQTTLDELGLTAPTTLDEVFAFCEDASSKGIYAYGQGLGDATAGPQMLTYAMNSTLIDAKIPDFTAQLDSGDVTYPDSAYVDQFEIYQKMFDAGCFGEGALGRSRDQGIEDAASGRAAGVVDVGAVYATLLGQAPDDTFVISPMPATNDVDDTWVTALPGFVTTINAKAKNPAAAQAFLEFLGTPEASKIYADGFASVPVLPNDLYTAPEALTEFADLIANGKNAPLATMQAEVQATLNQQLQAMFLGDTTPEGVAENMQDVFQK